MVEKDTIHEDIEWREEGEGRFSEKHKSFVTASSLHVYMFTILGAD